jgi:hypothetical protein
MGSVHGALGDVEWLSAISMPYGDFKVAMADGGKVLLHRCGFLPAARQLLKTAEKKEKGVSGRTALLRSLET